MLAQQPELEAVFLEVLKQHTAGSPQDEKIIWTDLSCTEIIKKIKEVGVGASRRAVKALLKKHKYKKRKIQKRLSASEIEGRNEQFCRIAQLKGEYLKSLNPIISVDTKKKEFMGICIGLAKFTVKKRFGRLTTIFPIWLKGK